jgi:hypothetical protein
MWMPFGLPWRPPSSRAKHCCKRMATALTMSCDQHDDPWDCPDVAVIYHEPFDEYGIPIRDGGMSYLLIEHCPWCGTALPAPRRDDWFDAMDDAGLDPDDTENLPKEFLCADWRLDKSL